VAQVLDDEAFPSLTAREHLLLTDPPPTSANTLTRKGGRRAFDYRKRGV